MALFQGSNDLDHVPKCVAAQGALLLKHLRIIWYVGS
jgi:hypothetical protein